MYIVYCTLYNPQMYKLIISVTCIIIILFNYDLIWITLKSLILF